MSNNWNTDWENRKTKMLMDFKLAKVEELLNAWKGDGELCEKLNEIKMLLTERLKICELERM